MLPVTPLAAGDGSIRFRGTLEAAGIPFAPDDSGPTWCVPSHVCRLARGVRRTSPPEAVLPEYLRDAGRKAPTVNAQPADARSRSARLAYADLPQVIAIERRAFPTPWSLAMFVLELSKPSGICLAALEDGGSSATWSARATTRSGT